MRTYEEVLAGEIKEQEFLEAKRPDCLYYEAESGGQGICVADRLVLGIERRVCAEDCNNPENCQSFQRAEKMKKGVR